MSSEACLRFVLGQRDGSTGKESAANQDDLNLIPGILIVGGKDRSPKLLSDSLHSSYGMHMPTRIHAHVHIK